MNMDRAIFDMNASVEATSLYILLCALSDEGNAVTLKMARQRWNSSEEDLFKGASELIGLGVLHAPERLAEDSPLLINSRDLWKRS